MKFLSRAILFAATDDPFRTLTQDNFCFGLQAKGIFFKERKIGRIPGLRVAFSVV